MISVSFNMSVMNTLNASQFARVTLMREAMQNAGCFVVTETIDLAVREGIYMWVGNPGIYVGKSNSNIPARVHDHIQKRFNGVEKMLKNLLRIDVKLPPQLLETMEQMIMEYMGYEEAGKGDSANRRRNYGPKRQKAYRRYKRLLMKICK